MYYGSGAGKLPTASAVVADMIEAAIYSKENIPLGWTKEKQEISSVNQGTFRYFLRAEGKEASKKKEISQLFHAERLVEIEGLSEFGLLTEAMTEEEFQKKRERISGIIRVIRAE